MNNFLTGCGATLLVLFSFPAWGNSPDPAPQVETLICFRHGEKPPQGMGQLDCTGLNRALALPKVLLPRYGKPDYIFAPRPFEKFRDEGVDYYFVRPLATVEPTAISCNMPILLLFGYTQTRLMLNELMRTKYQNSLVYVCWEHVNLAIFLRRCLTAFGASPAQVPDWPETDFDSIYVVKITRQGGHATIALTHEQEGLNHLSKSYPSP